MGSLLVACLTMLMRRTLRVVDGGVFGGGWGERFSTEVAVARQRGWCALDWRGRRMDARRMIVRKRTRRRARASGKCKGKQAKARRQSVGMEHRSLLVLRQ
jgi:hypothetical protein